MDNGPVIILSFRSQQLTTQRDALGAVVDGVDDTLQLYIYVCSLRRDPNELNTEKAWQVLDLGMFLQDDL